MTGRSKTFFPVPSLSSIPLPGIFQFITATILLLLTCVLVLGVHQYGLYHQCSQAVRSSDRLLFEFSAARDVISESIVGNRTMDLNKLTSTLQTIKDNAEQLENNVLLPDTLKRELINGRDMVNILAGMQSIQTRTESSVSDKWAFIKCVNELHNRLQQFRIKLSDRTKIILQGLHKTIIGTLGIIIVACCSLLFYLNRTICSPLVELCKLFPERSDSLQEYRKKGKAAVSMNDLLLSAGETTTFQKRLTSLLYNLSTADLPTSYNRLCAHLVSLESVSIAWIAAMDHDGIFTLMGCENSLDIPGEELLHSLTSSIQQAEKAHLLNNLIKEAQEKGTVQQAEFGLQGLCKVEENDQAHGVLVFPVPGKSIPQLSIGLHHEKNSAIPEYYITTSVSIASLLRQHPAEGSKVRHSTQNDAPAYLMRHHLFSVNGAMAAETASALTNSINGSINHCQQLIDMVDAGRDPDIMVVVLERIIREGNRSAALIRGMCVSEPESHEMLSTIEIRRFLETMQLILEKPMAAESIRFILDCNDDLSGWVQSSLFRLIIPTFIQLARKSITTARRHQNFDQTLLSLTTSVTTQDLELPHIIVACTIDPGRWNLDILDNDPAWPAYQQCLGLMQQYGGDIITTESMEKGCICLLFPAHATQSPCTRPPQQRPQ